MKLSSFIKTMEETDISYSTLLDKCRKWIAENHAERLQAVLSDSNAKKTLYDIIHKYVIDNNVTYDNYSSGEITDFYMIWQALDL